MRSTSSGDSSARNSSWKNSKKGLLGSVTAVRYVGDVASRTIHSSSVNILRSSRICVFRFTWVSSSRPRFSTITSRPQRSWVQ